MKLYLPPYYTYIFTSIITPNEHKLYEPNAVILIVMAVNQSTLLIGIFGMNLDQTLYLQPVNNSFAVTLSVIVSCMIILLAFIIIYLTWTGRDVIIIINIASINIFILHHNHYHNLHHQLNIIINFFIITIIIKILIIIILLLL